METITLNTKECNIDLKALLEKIDDIKPDLDLYSVLIDEQICSVEA